MAAVALLLRKAQLSLMARCCGALLLLATTGRAGAQVTPLQKVVELLDIMVHSAKEDKHQESLQYAAFEQFCSDITLEKQSSIVLTSQQIDLVRADIQKYSTEADRLAGEIALHIADRVSLDQQLEAAKVVRKAERKEHLAMRENLTESIDALARAVQVLQAQNFNRDGLGPTALLEKAQGLVAEAVPDTKRIFAAFLDTRGLEEPDLEFVPSVPVTAYKPRSADIVGMLEKLHEQFKSELHQQDRQEAERQHNYDMVHQDLVSSAQAADTAKDSKGESKARKEQLLAQVSSELEDLTTTLADDTKYLQDLTATCQNKKEEYAGRQKLRSEEIAALEEAITIIKSEDIASIAAKHLPSSLVQAHSSALMQKRQGSKGPESNQVRAAAFLRDESTRLVSHVLSTIATRVQADPFGKVKQLIEELLERLRQQAISETEHKGWCDSELARNGHTRKVKSEEVERLHAEIDSLTAKISQVGKDLAELKVALEAIDVAVANATDLRASEKAENEATVADAQKASSAVSVAMQLLSEFYASKASPTRPPPAGNSSNGTFVQTKTQVSREPIYEIHDRPPIFEGEAYVGQEASTGGVMGMLEVIRSDFNRLEVDTTAAETAAQAEYESFMEDSSILKAQKEVDERHKTRAKSDREEELEQRQSSLQAAQSALSSAKEEFDKLKPACFNQGQSFEERAARRKDEIEALKEALRILSGEDVAELLQRQGP